jgi:hypothetical protein
MKGIIILGLVFSLLVAISLPVFAETESIRAPIKWQPIQWGNKEWKSDDTAIQTAVNLFIMADWMQTRNIASNPDKFYETNNFLGPHPT